MQIDSFQYPINWQQVHKHHDAQNIGKEFKEGQIYQRCTCCNRRIGEKSKFSLCEDVQGKYGRFGPNTVIFLGIMFRLYIMTLVSALIYSIYSMIVNFQGNYCNTVGLCSFRTIFYYSSTYNILNDYDTQFVQLVLLCVLTLVILAFNLHIRYYSARKYKQISNMNLTDADYSIILRRLPDDTTQQDIRDLIQNQLQLKFFKDRKIPQRNLMKIQDIIMIYSLEETKQALNEKIDQFKVLIKKGKHQQFDKNNLNIPLPVRFANAAIVRFSSIYSKQCIKIKITLKEKLISYFFPFFKPRSQYKIRDNYISIQNAPEPSDIVWQNFGRSQRERVIRKIIFTAVNLVMLVCSCGMMIGLAKWNYNIKKQEGSPSIALTVITALIVFVLNRTLLGLIIQKATEKHYLDTKTDQDIQLMQKNVMHQAINLGLFSIFVPFLAALIGGGLNQRTIKQAAQEADLPLNMMITICIQAFGLPTQQFLALFFRVKERIFRKLVKNQIIIQTQTEANQTFKGPHIQFVQAYAIKVQLIWFGFAFATVSPISLPIAMLGILLSYLLQRLLYSKIYSIPQYGSPRINSEFVDLLDGAPLFVVLINMFIKYVYSFTSAMEGASSKIDTVLLINLALALFVFLMPWGNIIGSINFDEKQDYSIPWDQSGIEVTYESLNPAYKNINQIIKKQVKVQIRPIAKKLSFARVQSYNDNPENLQGLNYPQQKGNDQMFSRQNYKNNDIFFQSENQLPISSQSAIAPEQSKNQPDKLSMISNNIPRPRKVKKIYNNSKSGSMISSQMETGDKYYKNQPSIQRNSLISNDIGTDRDLIQKDSQSIDQ